jgi:hypothetical protein
MAKMIQRVTRSTWTTEGTTPSSHKAKHKLVQSDKLFQSRLHRRRACLWHVVMGDTLGDVPTVVLEPAHTTRCRFLIFCNTTTQRTLALGVPYWTFPTHTNSTQQATSEWSRRRNRQKHENEQKPQYLHVRSIVCHGEMDPLLTDLPVQSVEAKITKSNSRHENFIS